jgi:FKBP-type peptidyl-prolyl cis-trans isomerase
MNGSFLYTGLKNGVEMKKILTVNLLAITVFCGCFESGEQTKVNLDDEKQNYSYAMGMSAGSIMLDSGDPIDHGAFLSGLSDVLNGRETQLDKITAKQINDQKNKEFSMEKAMKKRDVQIEQNTKFLAENKAKEGVIETKTGLQYSVLEAGNGASPKATDTVTVHYSGSLIDGTVFDSSYDRNQPASFPLNQVISGWTEGLQLMPLGAKYRFVIPQELGYGIQGAGGVIPPYATLIFEVELLKIK